jgi:L-2-hydroxyglutarate oxidase
MSGVAPTSGREQPSLREQFGSCAPPSSCRLAIVGGGIIGIAVARELTLRHPHLSVCLLEREQQLATHQSGRSSGVIHAGIYYAPGSLKAGLCVQGARELYDYCSEHGVPHERCGKLIVASSRSELARLEELERRGRRNGVPGLRRIDARAIAEFEPHARGIAALHSPASGIVSFPALSRSFARDAEAGGATVHTGCEVRRVTVGTRGVRLEHTDGTTEADHAIFCTGAWADRLAVAAGADPDPRIVPFRGAYLRLVAERAHLVRSLIYPVPDPSLPFLGVHLTRHIDGDVLLGPTALLAAARDPHRSRSVGGADLWDTLTWPGTWRMFRRWWRTGAQELGHALLPRTLVRAAARYVPELSSADLEPAFVGVRAQALARDGRLLDDFVFSVTRRALHVRNAPSPAATASLAVARCIVQQAAREFDLGG